MRDLLRVEKLTVDFGVHEGTLRAVDNVSFSIPPGGTPKSKESRWIDIYEDDKLDESQMTKWFKQAAKLPGWSP